MSQGSGMQPRDDAGKQISMAEKWKAEAEKRKQAYYYY